MRIVTPSRSVRCAVIMLALATGGCDRLGLPTPEPTFAPGHEQLPGPGLVMIVGEPSTASSNLKIEYVLPDGSVVPARESIHAGDEIKASTWNNPGQLQLIVNSRRCSGVIDVESDRRTDVTLRIAPSGCEASVQRTVPLPS